MNNFWSTQPVTFLPDIGTFFNQDVEQAKRLIDTLASSGVSVIKGEILHDANICLKTGAIERYFGVRSGKPIDEDYRSLIERKVVSLDDYEMLFEYAKSLGLKIVLSVYDTKGVDFAVQLGCLALKVASSNITHQPLIEYMAKLGVPLIFDTGHTTIEEAVRAISWAKDMGNFDLLIEHSPPSPPKSVDLHNLNFMLTLASATQLPFGLSDHHSTEEMLYAAVAMGATVVEKGVCADDTLDEQDVAHAMCIDDVKNILPKINNIADALGDGVRNLPRNRVKYVSRMCLIAQKMITKDTALSLDNVGFAFPAVGIGTEYWSEVCGFCVNRDIVAGEAIAWSDVSG
jgi:sialic acid synthase SpsE